MENATGAAAVQSSCRASDAAEARRHKRLAAEFQRRTGLCQQLLDQLPPEPAKGE